VSSPVSPIPPVSPQGLIAALQSRLTEVLMSSAGWEAAYRELAARAAEIEAGMDSQVLQLRAEVTRLQEPPAAGERSASGGVGE
jgi:hypothetical protein